MASLLHIFVPVTSSTVRTLVLAIFSVFAFSVVLPVGAEADSRVTTWWKARTASKAVAARTAPADATLHAAAPATVAAAPRPLRALSPIERDQLVASTLDLAVRRHGSRVAAEVLAHETRLAVDQLSADGVRTTAYIPVLALRRVNDRVRVLEAAPAATSATQP